MNAIRSHYISRRVCWGLVIIMLASFMPLGLVSAFADTAKTVLVFPLQNSADNAPADLAQRATSALAMAIGDVPGFDAIQFSSISPSVRRAVSEGRVRQVDVEEGAGDPGTALVIGAALQVDYIVMGSIQSFTRKDAPGGVEMILSGQMYEVAPNIDPTTSEPVKDPKVAKAFGVSGASTTRSRQGTAEGPMIAEAVRDAAAKAAATISGRPAVESAAIRKSNGGGYKWVLFALLLGAVALAVNNGNGSAPAGPGADVLPPTNLALEQNQSAINFSWRAPTGTTLTILKYEMDRATDGAAFQTVSGDFGPSITSYNDYNTLTGRHTYQYRLRVVYTNTQVSAYAYSGALTITR